MGREPFGHPIVERLPLQRAAMLDDYGKAVLTGWLDGRDRQEGAPKSAPSKKSSGCKPGVHCFQPNRRGTNRKAEPGVILFLTPTAQSSTKSFA